MSETQKWVEASKARLEVIVAGHAERCKTLQEIHAKRVELEERMRKLGVSK